MKDEIIKFLNEHYDRVRPLLLAFSGGGDSTALLHLLLEVQKSIPFQLEVAHVDHGWREGSKQEQFELEKKIQALGLTFHKTRIEDKATKNLEDHGRKSRLKFLESLQEKYSYQAIFFAHHKDDLVETVLKRVLEGANLFNLYGMKPVARQGALVIWRPLLDFSKKNLENYLESQGISFIQDSTNLDARFLRGRMRKEIIPFLQKNFGKEFSRNLVYLANRSQDLEESLHQRTQELLKLVKRGPFGAYFDLALLTSFTKSEKKYFLYTLFQEEQIPISRVVLDNVFIWSLNKGSYKEIDLKDILVIIDRQKIFFLKQSSISLPVSLPLSVGTVTWENWKITLEPCESIDLGYKCSWQDLWEGRLNICVPAGDYLLSLNKLGELKPLKKWQSSKQVPVFLRKLVPVVTKESKVIADLLSGYQSFQGIEKEKALKIKIEIN